MIADYNVTANVIATAIALSAVFCGVLLFVTFTPPEIWIAVGICMSVLSLSIDKEPVLFFGGLVFVIAGQCVLIMKEEQEPVTTNTASLWKPCNQPRREGRLAFFGREETLAVGNPKEEDVSKMEYHLLSDGENTVTESVSDEEQDLETGAQGPSS